MLFICMSLGLIVLVTLGSFPFSGSASVHHSPRPIWLLGWGAQSASESVQTIAKDVLLNVLLFMPLGVSLTRRLTARRLLPRLLSLAVVFGTCCAVSYTIEVLQQFLPGRAPALRDVLANSGGGVLGWAGLYGSLWLWRRLRGEARTAGAG
jgi:glycopeptide antibiotics resistance protein